MNEEIIETYTMTTEEEIKWLRQCVRELQQENQQLKEEVIALRKGLAKARTRRDKYKRKYLKEKWENKLYKTVLDEIREYIKEELKFCENDSQGAYEICNLTISKYKHLLQILDKVKEC